MQNRERGETVEKSMEKDVEMENDVEHIAMASRQRWRVSHRVLVSVRRTMWRKKIMQPQPHYLCVDEDETCVIIKGMIFGYEIFVEYYKKRIKQWGFLKLSEIQVPKSFCEGFQKMLVSNLFVGVILQGFLTLTISRGFFEGLKTSGDFD